MHSGMKRKLQEVSANTPTKRGKTDDAKSLRAAVAKRQVGPAPPDTPPTPGLAGARESRFSVYRNFAEKSYTEGVHKSRCPCVDAKDVQRELRDVPAGSQQAVELKAKLAAIRDKGCRSHEMGRAVTLSRNDIEKNKARVDEKTIHGQKRKRAELAQDEQDGRRAVHDGESLERADMKRRRLNHATEALGFWEERVRRGIVCEEAAVAALLRELQAGSVGVARDEHAARMALYALHFEHRVADVVLTEEAIRAAIAQGEAATAERLFTITFPLETQLVQVAAGETRARKAITSEQIFEFGELSADNDLGRVLVLAAQECAGRTGIAGEEDAAWCELRYTNSAAILAVGEAEAREKVAAGHAAEQTAAWAHHRTGLLAAVDAEAARVLTAVAHEEHTARLAAASARAVVVEETLQRAGLARGFAAERLQLVEACEASSRGVIVVEEARAAGGVGAEHGLCAVSFEETLQRRAVDAAWCAALRDVVAAGEVSGRCAVEGEQTAAAVGVGAAHDALCSQLLLCKLEACEAAMRELITGEEDEVWGALAAEAAEEQRVLFGIIDDFLSAQDFLNTRQRLHNLSPWGVPDAHRLQAALNPHLFSLLTAANALFSTYEQKHVHSAEQHEIEVGQLKTTLNARNGEISKLTQELKETQSRLSFEMSQHSKLKASHELTKKKVENLDRQARSTAGANEKAKLEKQLRDMQMKLNATENALEKERARKRK